MNRDPERTIQIESPAKLNLSLLVYQPRADGYHPLDSLVQTIEWCDVLAISGSDEGTDSVVISGADLDPEDNLVVRAIDELRFVTDFPTLEVEVTKVLPVAAGLGGGSSNAAAMILGVSRWVTLEGQAMSEIATRLGADVPLFLTGGTLRMTGVGETIEPLQALENFAVAVVVPPFGLSTPEVYSRWDRLEGPEGPVVADADTPPELRGGMPLRNDLLPAAFDVEPRLGDYMADVRSIWGQPVCLTGAGSACFGYFPTLDEAQDAANAVSAMSSTVFGAALRDIGVAEATPVT